MAESFVPELGFGDRRKWSHGDVHNTCISFVGNWEIIKNGTDFGVIVGIVPEPACCGKSRNSLRGCGGDAKT